jgi:hypothetical protein
VQNLLAGWWLNYRSDSGDTSWRAGTNEPSGGRAFTGHSLGKVAVEWCTARLQGFISYATGSLITSLFTIGPWDSCTQTF